MSTDWMADAACSSSDPEQWFPEKGHLPKSHPAMRICAECPVRIECLEYAVTDPSRLDGIWGGLSVNQRRQIRSRRGIRTRVIGNTLEMCGTPAGAARHRRAGEKPCSRCRESENRRIQDHKERTA